MLRELLRRYEKDLPALTEEQYGLLEDHFELLRKWNKVLNLSAVRNEAEIAERHYAESLFLASRLPEGARTIADLGSGGGFPGVPLAAMCSRARVTLIESHQRKAAFLKEATRHFGNVRVLAKRAEDLPEHFEWMVSRAVKLSDISRTIHGMSDHTAILAGSFVQALPEGWSWEAPVKLPWGDHRYLVIGHAVR